MMELFDRKWFITLVASWFVIIILDELAHYWWKDLNPGHIFAKAMMSPPKPTQNPFPDEFGSGYPNGYRPAGGI